MGSFHFKIQKLEPYSAGFECHLLLQMAGESQSTKEAPQEKSEGKREHGEDLLHHYLCTQGYM